MTSLPGAGEFDKLPQLMPTTSALEGTDQSARNAAAVVKSESKKTAIWPGFRIVPGGIAPKFVASSSSNSQPPRSVAPAPVLATSIHSPTPGLVSSEAGLYMISLIAI